MTQEIIDMDKMVIYNNLFKGREDVFAMRWEKADGSKSGYTPVCINEWRTGVCNKLGRGKCKDCGSKNYAKWSNFYLQSHLYGQKTYGIYPLLPDNHSYLLAVDFDGKNWVKDTKIFTAECVKHNLSPHLERSRSGCDAHIWFFFEDKYLASKSRNIFLNILREAKLVDRFSRDESFDRIYPSQDFVGNNEIGNQVVLPLQGKARQNQNTVFLNQITYLPVDDQWAYLSGIKKTEIKILDQAFNKLNNQEQAPSPSSGKALKIVLSNQIYLDARNIPPVLTSFLKEKLNFINPEYSIKKRMGVGVYNVEKYFNFIESQGSRIGVPVGFLNKLINFLNEYNIGFEIDDQRLRAKSLKFKSNLRLFDYQEEAIRNLLLSESGVLVAPPGSGKTIVGIELIARLNQPALILVHKKQIFDQWVERIDSFLNIPKKNIGQIGSSKKKIGEQVMVAMIQTLNKSEVAEEMKNKFGLIIVDECHHLPAKMFRTVITKFNPYYLYGLTATPERKYKDERLIFIFIGDTLHTISREDLNPQATILRAENKINVMIRETELELPLKSSLANFQPISKVLVYDSGRNHQITGDIETEVNNGRKCLVLTERKEHADILNLYLNQNFETIVLTGNLTDKQKRDKIAQVETGDYQIIIATGQLLGEGTDFNNLDCLFLVFPFSFHGKLTQYIGRLTREQGNEKTKKIYDYRDSKIDYLEKLFKKRASYYKKSF